MPTKGASYRYGNTNGSKHRGEASKNINYAWARGFNRGGIDQHFKDHGKEFGAKDNAEYAAKAVHFANNVDREHYKSVVDYRGTTYKYDCRDRTLVEVTKDGYVVSYRHFGEKFWYMPKKGKTEWIIM